MSDLPADRTHLVENQAPPLQDVNLYALDAALQEGVRREGGAWGEAWLNAFGARVGSAETIELGRLANEHEPVLKTHDRFGNRIDEVEFHPAWHELMQLATEDGVHCQPWRDPRPGAHVVRVAGYHLFHQVEQGTCCPITMTFASVPALRVQPDVAAEWVPRVTAAGYDRRSLPAGQKSAALIGMAMTEKQGGSDVRANSTRAVPVGTPGPGQPYLLTGHKWFCSAPMCDAFLTLAHTEAGLSCFLLPRWRPDGTRNVFQIQRLKDKLGNRSNASSEVEYRSSWAQLVGEEGRGVRTILEMVQHTRLDCVNGSAALMRQALTQAVHHASHRQAFGKHLLRQPLMQNVLADLSLEVEAAQVLTLRLARAYDNKDDPAEAAFARIATAIGKYWVCKRASYAVAEAMEVHGGNGYVEESNLPRLYREAPLNSIWEGSGNVICLDVLRAVAREPDTLPSLVTELELGRGNDPRFDAYLDGLLSDLERRDDLEVRARRIVERLALALQASLLVRHAPDFVADAFCASRLDNQGGRAFGTLPANAPLAELMARITP